MPTEHARIPVTRDEALDEALGSVAALYPGKKPATLVHDLAVKGARAALDDDQRRREAMRRLANWAANLDDEQRDLLERIDEVAWGNE